ncbi:MAG TPA: hypothetical protein VM370_03020 [Candidatus Thermoplasmatota archaeon]|nr:hypothetical protein [Candidatus Thermoplasmatota archaeon]
MAHKLLAILGLLTLFALPMAAAGNETNIYTPPTIDVNVHDGDGGADESTFAGLSTTVVIVLIVLAVLVVALIVAMASRGP